MIYFVNGKAKYLVTEETIKNAKLNNTDCVNKP